MIMTVRMSMTLVLTSADPVDPSGLEMCALFQVSVRQEVDLIKTSIFESIIHH
jgi:hypothetical protein